MFLIRRAKAEDVPTLLKLAKLVHFINLPADKDLIAEKVQWSRECFLEVATRLRPDGSLAPAAPPEPSRLTEPGGLASLTGRSRIFMFVLEDTDSGGVLGTSQIITSMGGPGHPNLSFELLRKQMFSTSLQMGTTHTVARLKLDESGPTEIGGLILQPSYRGHKARLGRFVSLIRFHFMGLYRAMVADRVLAEMMGPITPDGQNTLWEYLGRRFINLSYTEADRFCQHSKEFMLSLLPREEIYLTLLPPEARAIIAQVGPETQPAKRMLEKLGFEYRNCVDPFDGGPNLEAATDNIVTVKQTRRLRVGEALASGGGLPAMLSTLDEDGEFVAVQAESALDGDVVRLPREAMSALQLRRGGTVGFTPLASANPAQPAASAAPSPRSSKSSSRTSKPPPARIKGGA